MVRMRSMKKLIYMCMLASFEGYDWVSVAFEADGHEISY